MLPFNDRVLSLEEIAEYWARELNHHRTMEEIYDELLSAFWQGRLVVYGSIGKIPVDRRQLLKAIKLTPEHPGFTIVDSRKDITRPLSTTVGSDISIDLTIYIVLLGDSETWTDDIVKAAYRILATMSFQDFSARIKPGLRALCATRESLGTFCHGVPYPLPRFWFADTKPTASFGGRPSVMRQIIEEMKRRARQNALSPKLREEAAALLKWAEQNIDKAAQLPTVRSIENGIRKAYNKLRQLGSTADHKT